MNLLELIFFIVLIALFLIKCFNTNMFYPLLLILIGLIVVFFGEIAVLLLNIAPYIAIAYVIIKGYGFLKEKGIITKIISKNNVSIENSEENIFKEE